MHLLNAQTAPPADDAEQAVDLGQTPGDIVVLSAADTDLACLAAAQARRPPGAPTLRLANLLRLGHPLSVDLYVEKVIGRARLVILRLLGGRSYWPYGLEQIASTCRARGIPLAVVPGDDQPDPELAAWSTLPPSAAHRLWQYGVHGGIDNAEQLLAYADRLLGGPSAWREPAPLLRAGLYGAANLDELRRRWRPDRPIAALVFYRALVQAADTAAVDALIAALEDAGLNSMPIFTASLKDPVAGPIVAGLIAGARPAVILNATGFAVASPGREAATPFDEAGCPVLQVVLSGGSEAAWREGSRGLPPRDLAMNVALPEVDGRVLSRAVAFKAPARFDPATQAHLVGYAPVPDRARFAAELTAAWARLARTPVPQRRVALVLANYPTRDGRLANGVGLDTPASTVRLLQAMRAAGYRIENTPETGQALIAALAAGVTNQAAQGRTVRARLSLDDYRRLFAQLPERARRTVTDRWGPPEADPTLEQDGAFPLAVLPLGNIVVGVQPARGYHIDPVRSYHDPDLPPPHAYLAFYIWLREVFGAHAILHMGKHGNLEWLPGKAVALSQDCLPEAALGPLPHVYPFIVNDPGEGTQAKRRAAAVIVDHLTPPLTRAETYGPLHELERLVDEYYEAAALDPRRAAHLRGEILSQSASLGLDRDCGVVPDDDADSTLTKLDNHLCELKELQIRDGLHVFGEAPAGEQLTDLLAALVRVPRDRGEGGDASLIRALAVDLGLGDGFDPLACPMAEPWTGPRPPALTHNAPWRSNGDTVERLELLARALVAGERTPDPVWTATRAVLGELETRIRPALLASGRAELTGVLTALDGRFLRPGPSGAPTRGRLDVLPTGRNFYSVDSRAVPTAAAWQLGWKSAALLVERYVQEHGDWPRAVALTAWGTANMRTGGDDIAQALALLGVRPTWDNASQRVTGFEILPLSLLERPRVDVTLRVSGFFRDAFPAQIELVDDAVRAVAALADEPEEDNPLAARVARETAALAANGVPEAEARRRASYRVFGSKPGAYGAGLQALIDERGWEGEADLARAYVAWGGYAYGRRADGIAAHSLFERRLGAIELVLHNQDNREHDILDSDDYYQFEGGLTAAVRVASGGHQPEVYHNDHSRPESPRVRTLREEIARIVRGRAANPKWLQGVMRHGYKGAFEIAATVDYLFAFAATARVVEDHHFDALFDAYLRDEEVRTFIAGHNPAALREIAERFQEAADRGLWRPRANDARERLAELRQDR